MRICRKIASLIFCISSFLLFLLLLLLLHIVSIWVDYSMLCVEMEYLFLKSLFSFLTLILWWYGLIIAHSRSASFLQIMELVVGPCVSCCLVDFCSICESLCFFWRIWIFFVVFYLL
ncbi:putative membrane protein [Heliorestis convoluta]|uniref:Putative membrane protein n=1 Tax=Heliorestis convoluta TaxID=356322 RepID=A0A5Q2N1W3_9FIRM|nr:putative membrane protein [Heliorestis convoluta]